MVDALQKCTCLIKVCMHSESSDLNIKIKCTLYNKEIKTIVYKQSK